MATHLLLLYIAAAIGLSVTPGPNSLLALTHGATHGHRRTLFTIAGGAIGFIALIALSMLGIGALLQASAHALTFLKFAGGAYLIWLGIQVWRSPSIHFTPIARTTRTSAATLFRTGLLTAISNPKGLLFYGAFLPQFIDPTADILPQFALMATIFVAIECVFEFFLAALAQRIRPFLERTGKTFNRICGGLFIAMGIALPATR
jgi:threonine/homoserine/homoserine lactone efflux protein